MAKAAANLPQAAQTSIVSVEYMPDNRILVTLGTEEGLLELPMTATALLTFVNMATATINKRTAQFIAAAV